MRSATCFVAGGNALSGTLSGTYHYEGAFISALSTALDTVREGRFALTATFVEGGNGSFTFTGTTNATPLDSSTTQTSRLAVTTGGTVNASTGVLLATEGVYTEGTGVAKTADARLDGRVFGVGGVAVAGLFTTTSGATTYVGGFVGEVIARDLYSGSGATGNSIGQAFRSVFSDTAHSAGRILFLGDNYETHRNALNVASDAARNQSILSGLGVAATGGTAIGNLTKHTGVSVAHGSPATTASATILQDSGSTARLFAFSDLLVAGGKALSGTPAGTYQYEGVFISAPGGTALGTLREGTFLLSVDFNNSSNITFTGTTNDTPSDSSTTQTSRLAFATGRGAHVGTSQFDASTGVLQVTAATYTEGTGTDRTANARLDGRIHGLGGGAVAGLFATTSGATAYVGGFIGAGPQVASDLYTGSGTTGNSIGQVNWAKFFDTQGYAYRTGHSLFLGDSYAARRDKLNSPSATVRNQSILVSGSPASSWQDSNSTASLRAFSDLFVARGNALSGTLSGTYHYEGAFISALSTALDTVREGRFALTATFVEGGNGSFTFRGTTNATPLDSSTTQTSGLAVTTGGTINASTGVLLATEGVYTEGTGATKTMDTRLDGRVFGAGGVAAAGLFTTTSGATTYVGGFVGEVIVRDLYSGSGATGNSIGQAFRSVFSGTAHSAGRILFLGDNYETRRNGLNVASDTTRNQSILSGLGVAATGGTAIGNLTKHTGVSVAHGSPATTASATIWQDSGSTARLFAFSDLLVAGGKALSSTLAGTYQYEGVFVSASGGTALGTLREGTFSLSVDFTYRSSLTFTGTTNATPSDSSTTQTSRLAVTTGRGAHVGTSQFDASTGVIQVTAATYTEGTGTDRTANARLDGRILGLGGGAVAGLFTTTSGATTYVGGFVGAGAQVASDLYTGSGTTGNSIGQANWAEVPDASVYTTPTGRILFLGDSYAARRDELNSPSATVRSQNILFNLAGTGTGGGVPGTSRTASGSLTKYTGVSVHHGSAGTAAQATIWQNSNSTGRLVAFSDLFVAGGNALSGTLSGTYHYEGAFISALSTALETVREGTFALTATFVEGGNGSFTFTGTTNATPLDSSTTQTSRLAVTTGGTVNASTGVLLATAGVYTEGTGAAKTADARLDGRVFGVGGVAVAGLFTTTARTTTYVGGFVGEVIARDLYSGSGATGNSIGQAIRSVFSDTAHSAGRILFLGDNYETRRNGLNVASDPARNQSILSSLGVAANGRDGNRQSYKTHRCERGPRQPRDNRVGDNLAGQQPGGTAVCVQ